MFLWLDSATLCRAACWCSTNSLHYVWPVGEPQDGYRGARPRLTRALQVIVWTNQGRYLGDPPEGPLSPSLRDSILPIHATQPYPRRWHSATLRRMLPLSLSVLRASRWASGLPAVQKLEQKLEPNSEQQNATVRFFVFSHS